MEIVNGYICMNCCDVDKARLGQDPHQSTDQLKKQIERHLDKLAAGNFGPSVTFGGSLQTTDSADNGASGNGNSAPSNSNGDPGGGGAGDGGQQAFAASANAASPGVNVLA
jgi:hypothetical protein